MESEGSFVITVEQAAKFAPIVTFSPWEKFFPCSIEWILTNSTLHDKNSPTFIVENPTQNDLAKYYQKNYYLKINNSFNIRKGQPIKNNKVIAPMYVCAQEWDNFIVITYNMLYAYQGGQTVRFVSAFNNFNCIVNDYGSHQGDLERCTVRVTKDFTKVLSVGFTHHGDTSYYPFGSYESIDNHPIVRVALNSHACYPHQGNGDWITLQENEVIKTGFDIIDVISYEGKPGNVEWRPFELGDEQYNTYVKATDVDGTDLDSSDSSLVSAIATVADRMLSDDYKKGNGPEALGDCAFIYVKAKKTSGAMNFDIGYTQYNTRRYTPPSVIFSKDKFHMYFVDFEGDGLMHIVSNDGIYWETATPYHPDIRLSGGPAAWVHDEKVHIVLRDGDGNGLLYFVSDDGGYNFHGGHPFYLGVNIDGQPSVAINEQGVTIVVAVGHDYTGIMQAVWIPAKGWSNKYIEYNTNSNVPPGIVWHKDNWFPADPFHLEIKLSAGPCPFVHGDRLHILFREFEGNDICHSFSKDDGNTFEDPYYIGQKCDGQPQVTIGNKGQILIVCVNAEGNGMMRAIHC
ncbi:4810_t:CDS:2 [Paraglomus occultum]|uniref:4810_t:CDS:1 n=1 Tax=Paraglomus occultum TaxID=144539 RepID=A0A9N9FEE6_9GLOM|nr:4810_t:CDS:2 [Paraglomus occultum]